MKQDIDSEFGDPIGDDESDTTTNFLISKENDLRTKLDYSNMKTYNFFIRLKSWFNTETSKEMEGLLSGSEKMLEGVYVDFFLADNSGEPIKFREAYNLSEPDTTVK
jgi:hypothetical protein